MVLDRDHVQRIRRATVGGQTVFEGLDELAARVGVKPNRNPGGIGVQFRGASGDWYDFVSLLLAVLNYVDIRSEE